jgi:hypothetical protein
MKKVLELNTETCLKISCVEYILREERRLKVFENGVLRGVFGPRTDEVTGEWKKLHNEEFNDVYS